MLAGLGSSSYTRAPFSSPQPSGSESLGAVNLPPLRPARDCPAGKPRLGSAPRSAPLPAPGPAPLRSAPPRAVAIRVAAPRASPLRRRPPLLGRERRACAPQARAAMRRSVGQRSVSRAAAARRALLTGRGDSNDCRPPPARLALVPPRSANKGRGRVSLSAPPRHAAAPRPPLTAPRLGAGLRQTGCVNGGKTEQKQGWVFFVFFFKRREQCLKERQIPFYCG